MRLTYHIYQSKTPDPLWYRDHELNCLGYNQPGCDIPYLSSASTSDFHSQACHENLKTFHNNREARSPMTPKAHTHTLLAAAANKQEKPGLDELSQEEYFRGKEYSRSNRLSNQHAGETAVSPRHTIPHQVSRAAHRQKAITSISPQARSNAYHVATQENLTSSALDTRKRHSTSGRPVGVTLG